MWQANGVIFHKHHAQLPTVVKGHSIRVYYSTKIGGLSHIRFFEIDEQLNITSQDKEALAPGDGFDHSGVMPSCAADNIMYYTGWHLRDDVPYGHAIGAAKICENGTLERIGVVLKGNRLMNSPYVEWNNNRLEMLYCSGTGWIGNYPTYNISMAIKNNDVWETKGVVITHNEKDEAISRASKAPDGSIYYAWRQKDTPYRLSKMDTTGSKQEVHVPRSDWDSDMQCYPFVCEIGNSTYMFYNGNGYGATGIGVAQWKQDID